MIKPGAVRFEFPIVPHPDFIFFQPLLHGIQIEIPLGQKSFRRAPSKEPIIHIPRLNFQLFGDFIPSHISIQSLLETKEYQNFPKSERDPRELAVFRDWVLFVLNPWNLINRNIRFFL